MQFGSTFFDWVVSAWSNRRLGPVLDPPNSNLNLPLLTLCTKDSIKESRDSGMKPFIQGRGCIVSCISSFKLSKLNNTAVVSLSVSDASKSWCRLCPLVMKGSFPSIHAQVKFEFFSGAQGGLVENLFVAICSVSWSIVSGLVGIELVEASEFAGVGGTAIFFKFNRLITTLSMDSLLFGWWALLA